MAAAAPPVVMFVRDGRALRAPCDAPDSALAPWDSAPRELANGGAFGRVFDVQHAGRACVLKVTPRSPTRASRRERERARRECQLLARLAARVPLHPHLCAPLDAWTESDGRACLLFERKPLDLFEFMKLRCWRGLPLSAAGRVLRHVCDALRCLHTEFDTVHNDVKPENILIDPDTLHCWLADFGGASPPSAAANNYDNDTRTRMFESPERRARLPFDARSDSWALGMLAIDLFGRPSLDALIDAARWNELMAQVCEPSEREHWIEPIDEPAVRQNVTYCCTPSAAALSRQRTLRAFLNVTVRLSADNRCSADQLLGNVGGAAGAFLQRRQM